MLKTTPFHERTAALCLSHAWRRWAGCVVASSYELSHEREYHAIRSSAALLDISPLYKYVIRGKQATSADPNLRWLQDNALGLEVTIEDVSDSIGALARGTDVDKPRNLAKSVTVE